MSNEELEELGDYGWEVLSLSPFRMGRDAQFAGGFHCLESVEEAQEELRMVREYADTKKIIAETYIKNLNAKRKANPRDPERIEEILYKLGELWKTVPDWRLGQLLYNLKQNANQKIDIYYLEDCDLIEEIDKLLEHD